MIIPYEIDGNKVSIIGKQAFIDNHTMKTLVIPDGITAIRSEAFRGCTGLSVIEFNAVNCVVPDVWIYDGSKGTGVFSGAGAASVSGLKVIFGDKVARVPDYLFDTASIDEYGHNGYAFANVTSVDISDSVKEIGACAFRNCQLLNEIHFGAGVKTIGNYAFSICTALPTLTFDDALISIGDAAFLGDTSLEAIEWGTGLDSIGTSAFQGCTSLENLAFPNVLTTINRQAFLNCASLETLYLPKSVVNLNAGAFCGCTKLERIVFDCPNLTVPAVWIYADDNGVGVFSDAGSASVNGLKVTFGEEVTKVPAYLFDTASLDEYGHTDHPYAFVTEVEFPASITDVGDYAFRNCQRLTSVRFHGLDAAFGNGVFDGCVSPEFHVEGLTNGLVEQYAQSAGYPFQMLSPEAEATETEVDGIADETISDEHIGTKAVTSEASDSVGTWTCKNGHAGNTANFCPECGAPKPVNACPNCGLQFPEGVTYKYCPDCGTQIR